MRIWHMVVCGLVVGVLVGCGTSPGTTGGAKPNAAGAQLKKDCVGTWERDDGKVTYAFKDGDDYEAKSGDVTVKGKYKVVDDKTVEMTFKLTKDQVDTLKPLHDHAKKGIDKINGLAKKLSDDSIGTIPYKPIDYPPEPKEGDNSWKESVEVKGDTAKISGTEYKKKK